MTRSFVRSAFCLPLAFACLLGFTAKALADDAPGYGEPADHFIYRLKGGLDTRFRPEDRRKDMIKDVEAQIDDRAIRIYFNGKKGQVAGSTSCASYTGTYKTIPSPIPDESRIQISKLNITRKKSMDCTMGDSIATSEYFQVINNSELTYSYGDHTRKSLLLQNEGRRINLEFTEHY